MARYYGGKQTELPLDREMKVQSALETLQTLRDKVVALSDIPELPPVRLAGPQDMAPQARTSAIQEIARSGTRIEPYERRDGRRTLKISFVGTEPFAARLRTFTAALPPSTSRNEWIEQVLSRAMDDYAGPR